jgi:putative nucleotidyltransferase with HDIG domain
VDYKSFIAAVRNLPTPSAVLLRIESVVQDQNATASDVADAIGLDPAISSKILRLANSAYLGIPRTITSHQNAVVLLGNKKIHSLVLASELLNTFKAESCLSFSLEKFWIHSVTTALIAESIARQLRKYETVDVNDIFICGLLHDIGKLVTAQLLPDNMDKTFESSLRTKTPYWKNEDPQLVHTATGEKLAEHWSFPSILRAVIRNHHEPEKDDQFPLECSIVHISDITAHIIGRSTFDAEIPPVISQFALDMVKLTAERFRVIAESAINNTKKVDSILEMFSSSEKTI